MPTVPVNDVFALITNKSIIQSFNDEGIYINDIDFKQDFAGVINKEEVIQYLIENNEHYRWLRNNGKRQTSWEELLNLHP